MTFSPFYMGNDTIPYEADGYVRSNNYGMQMSFMIPLDGGMIELCKQIAKRHEQKMRLNYEMIRAMKCTEIMKAGFTFRPGSRVEVTRSCFAMAKKKATEDQFNELHNLITKEFLARIKSGEATTQDLKAACDWLKANDISGVAYDGNPLSKLANVMPEIDPEMVQKRLYGSSVR
jgi:hypothetical protein